MNARTHPVLTGIILCLAAAGGYQFVLHWKIQRALAATMRPFTIVLADSGYQRSGSDFVEVEKDKRTWSVVSRRGDGSRAEIALREYDPPSKIGLENKKLFLMPSQTVASMNYIAMAKSTSRLKVEEAIAMKALPKDPTCKIDPNLIVQPELMGEGEILGYRTIKRRFVNETAIIEQELAPNLDCETLRSKISFMDKDKAVDTISLKEAISVLEGEPEAWVFEEANFPEMKPSDLVRRESAANGVEMDLEKQNPMMREKLKRMDAAYERRQ